MAGNRSKKIKTIATVVFVLMILALIAGIIYLCFFDSENKNPYAKKGCFVIIAALISGSAKIIRDDYRGSSLNKYKKAYANIIKESFCDDKKNLKKLLRSMALYNVYEFKKSISILDSLLPQCKTTEEKYCVNLFRALNYTDDEDLDTAEKIYSSMIDGGIADGRIYSNLVQLYNELGNFEKSLEVGKEAVSFSPNNYIAYNNIASAAFHLGDYEHAVEYAKNCLEIKNDFTPSIKLIYLIYALEKNPEAEVYEKRAIANGASKKELKDALRFYLGEN